MRNWKTEDEEELSQDIVERRQSDPPIPRVPRLQELVERRTGKEPTGKEQAGSPTVFQSSGEVAQAKTGRDVQRRLGRSEGRGSPGCHRESLSLSQIHKSFPRYTVRGMGAWRGGEMMADSGSCVDGAEG